MLSQTEEHSNEAKQELENFGGISKFEWIQLNLKNLKQTHGVAKLLAEELKIDGVSVISSKV